MKLTALLALLATTLAAPLDDRATSKPYTLRATQTDSSGVLDAPIHANDFGLWVHRATASYCPTEVAPDCPAGNRTVFLGASMDVVVPGGQLLYFGPRGKARYTQAHDGTVPANSTIANIKEILTGGERTWLCDLETGDPGYAVWVAKNSTARPEAAGRDDTCTRVTLVAESVSAEEEYAWQYV